MSTKRELELGKKLGRLQAEVRRWERTNIGSVQADLERALLTIEDQKSTIEYLRNQLKKKK